MFRPSDWRCSPGAVALCKLFGESIGSSSTFNRIHHDDRCKRRWDLTTQQSHAPTAFNGSAYQVVMVTVLMFLCTLDPSPLWT